MWTDKKKILKTQKHVTTKSPLIKLYGMKMMGRMLIMGRKGMSVGGMPGQGGMLSRKSEYSRRSRYIRCN